MSHSKNILIITYWSYSDALIQNYTLPYAELILKTLPPNSQLFLLTLDKQKSEKSDFNKHEFINNVSIKYQPFGFWGIILWLKTIFILIRLIKKEKIELIHCWCTPAGMIGYLLSVLTGKELIIDSYEPHAEAMVENGAWKKNSFAFKLLFKFEKLQTNRAKYLIAVTQGMKDYSAEKFNHLKNNIFVKPACVDLQLFSFKNKKKSELMHELLFENKIVCVYAGKFGGIYLEKEVFDFFKVAERYWGDKFRVLILSAHQTSEINEMCVTSKLNTITVIHKFVSHHQIPDYIGLADFAITPVKSVPTKKYCSPIKDGEYWALGLPVVITNGISDDTDIIMGNKIGSVLKDLNAQSYLKSVKEIDELLKSFSSEELFEKIRPIAEKYRNFEIAKSVYKTIYGSR